MAKNDDDYKELDFVGWGMDQDGALDGFLSYKVIEKYHSDSFIIIVLGGDEPGELEEHEALESAMEKAEFEMQSKVYFVANGPVVTRGQNELAIKEFVFSIFPPREDD